jgi:hypothetical protein
MVAWKMAYQITPIILTGGIAAAQGNGLPIVALTDPTVSGITVTSAGAAITGSVSGGNDPQLDGFFASYMPLPGGSIINNQIATYPFANQSVAANAIITQPLNISMLMTCPAGVAGSYWQKQTVMSSLQSSLAQHNSLGGTYSIITPAFIYTYCIMTGMRDVSGGDSKQVQYAWQMDFAQPLVTTQAAAQAQNTLLQRLTAQTPPTVSTNRPGGLPVSNPSQAVSGIPTLPTIVVQATQ